MKILFLSLLMMLLLLLLLLLLLPTNISSIVVVTTIIIVIIINFELDTTYAVTSTLPLLLLAFVNINITVARSDHLVAQLAGRGGGAERM